MVVQIKLKKKYLGHPDDRDPKTGKVKAHFKKGKQ